VALAGILWAALDVSWTVLCAIGLVSLALILAIAALRKRNEQAPFPFVIDVLVGLILSLWVRWLWDWLLVQWA
jgi:hypothetical protein